jgi:type VI secretion system FHA domain protein
MLTARSKGFMGARDAMRHAYDDLRAHQLGLMAGMRSALAGVLARFEPGRLEARVAAHSLLDRLQPSGRKARLWDLYEQHYAELAREASDDFNALFGKAFLVAYEQQIGRLQASDRESRTDSAGAS